MADDKTLASDESPESSLRATHQVQLAVNEVFERFAGPALAHGRELGDQDAVADVAEVKEALHQALRAHGLPQQPEQWIDATASEIAGGRRLVIDAREELPPSEGRPDGGRTSRDVERELEERNQMGQSRDR
ncbi:MAG TPA: hypothetical protein VKB14_12055 [Actinomycetales bacterium]|nr:hypothetical protein [Actinomycetales bacterium]